MTREIALHCMKSYSELHSDLCELCPIYGQTGSDHCFEDALQYVIGMLEQEPTTKNNLGVDCISRDAVLKPYEGLKDEDTISVWLIRKNIEQQPFVKQEPKIGHWIDTDEWRETVDGFEQWGYFRKCSKCGYVFKFLEIDNYCPNCGADMREVKE